MKTFKDIRIGQIFKFDDNGEILEMVKKSNNEAYHVSYDWSTKVDNDEIVEPGRMRNIDKEWQDEINMQNRMMGNW